MAIVQRFPFSSALQRMSVVTVTHGGRSALAFIKGSPEMVASLCHTQTGSKLTRIITIVLVTFTHVLVFLQYVFLFYDICPKWNVCISSSSTVLQQTAQLLQ